MTLETIQENRHDEKIVKELLPIVQCSLKPTKYERILLTQLRDKNHSTKEFRHAANTIAELLIEKIIECLETLPVQVETPLTICDGEILDTPIDLVSVMRAGDGLLGTFITHFPKANISKMLIQRDEKTAKPIFQYMKLSSTIALGHPVIIIEPMVGTGGTLEMAISLLKERGVEEKNIIVACICAAPEGLLKLSHLFPRIRLVLTVLDEKLNEIQYITPGLGDFGDRYFGTYHDLFIS